jgi:murein DD-endopeptidase MepM/ murein hydrolase activator NlpD
MPKEGRTDGGRLLWACSALLAVAAAANCGGSPTTPDDFGSCPGTYPAQDSSLYVLPYRVGQAFRMGQGNCDSGSHARGSVVQFAYDFLMPIGTEIVAARDGRVLLVEARFADGTRIPGQENYINVEHQDGTIAAYVHLTTGGVLVRVGDQVRRGEVIGLSGDSGSSTEPHLHFHVQACTGCATAAIVFRNTRPHPRGLQRGETYIADPYQF